MSGLLSKAWQGVEDGLWTPLLDHIASHGNVSRTTATLGVLSGVTAATSLVVYLWRRPRNLPPGPTPMPLLGNILQMTNPKFYISLHELYQKYGDIMTIYMGSQRVIVLSSHELIRDAFVRQADVTSDRPYMLPMEIFSANRQDIVHADMSPRLLIQRKLAHQALRRFSAGGGLTCYVANGFDAMWEKLMEDPRLNCTDMGFLVVYNILLSMCFGKPFELDDPFFCEMSKLMKSQDEAFSDFSIADTLGVSQYLPLSKGNQLVTDIVEKLSGYIEGALDEHKLNFDKNNLADFTDHLLNVMQEVENDPNENSHMKLLTRKNYVMIISDLFLAGTDTTRMTLSWLWHYLAAYPEVQRKAQQEIDDVIGKDGEVDHTCRDKLPYVDAVLHEVMRIATVSPFGLFHKTRADIKLGGYDIPAGTTLCPNTWSIHFDTKYWKDPEAFLPERWLDEQGNYQYIQAGFVPFSMGRRSCIGESFAKLELHMLLTMTLQKFTITPTPGYTVSLNPIDSLMVVPEAQKPLIATRR